MGSPPEAIYCMEGEMATDSTPRVCCLYVATTCFGDAE